MPSKKKPKPSFQVPEELQSAPQAGWVYRSDEPSPAKAAKTAPKAGAGGKATGRSKRVESETPAAAPKPPHADKSKPAAAPASDSKSNSSSAVLDLTAKALSAGFGTAGGFVLLATTLIAAPFALGKRIMHL